MNPKLLGWLEAPSDKRGLRFADEDEGWDFHSYANLAASAGGIAAQIEDARSEAGRPVVQVLPTRPTFVAAFFGTLLAGDTPCPLPPPAPLQRERDYRDHLAGVLEVAEPSLIVTDESLEGIVAQAAERAGVDVPRLCPRDEVAEPRPRPPADLALLQFTSGSSGRPRGVCVTPDNLEANIDVVLRWVGAHRDTRVVTWLPLFHDMGLIGFLLAEVLFGLDTWLMRPDQFVRRPARWLDCLGRIGASVTASPPFGYAYARRRVREEELEGCDFSEWSVAIAAAERLDASILASFGEWLAPYGFRPSAFRPAYGLAENTLAVTGTPLGTTPPVVSVDPDGLRLGGTVDVIGRCSLADANEIGTGAGWLVGSGIPHPEIEVEVRDEGGAVLPEGHLGEIHVKGRCVARGYMGDATSGSTRIEGDLLCTGDAGFVLDDELYVIGRMGDSVKVHGRLIYMEDLEAEVKAVPGVPKGRLAAIAGAGAAGDVVCVVVEAPADEWVDPVAEALRRSTSGELVVRVFTADRGTIMRTSSGKPRRKPMWRALMEDRLDVELVRELSPSAQCLEQGGAGARQAPEPVAP